MEDRLKEHQEKIHNHVHKMEEKLSEHQEEMKQQ